MSNRKLDLGFAGTPQIAATILEQLLGKTQYSISCVITQPDKPAGRGRKSLNINPVKQLALKHRIPLLQPGSLADIDDGMFVQLDALVVVAYGQIVPERLLALPRFGCINVHTSLLPRWRGAAPIQRAIEAGDSETGVSIMQMDKGLDTGPVLLQRHCPISQHETAESLHDKLATLGADTLIEALDHIDTIQPVVQDDALVTYASKLTKAEAQLDWQETAEQLERKVRAFNPSPVAFFEMKNLVLRVRDAEIIMQQASVPPGCVQHCDGEFIDIATGAGLLRLRQFQPAGKKIMTVREFLNGHPDFFQSGTDS